MKPCLLLVDLQADFLNAPGLQPAPETVVAQAAALLDGCRQKHIPVVHIWTTLHRDNDQRLPHWKKRNLWQCVAGSAGHKSPAPLEPLAWEPIIHKRGFNAFASGELDAWLKAETIAMLFIAGVHLHTCVRTAAMEGMERGLQVVIAGDATASNDPIYAAATRRWLAARDVEFVGTRDLMARLAGRESAVLKHHSPRETQKVLFEIPITGVNEIKIATAFAQSEWNLWQRTSLNSRCAILEQAAARLAAAAPDLARQMAIEIGKPIAHGVEEVNRAAENIRDAILRAFEFEFQAHSPAGIVRHQPIGVVALISPWNNPVAIPLGKIAPALIYGNTVVWKPAPPATKISKHLLQLLHESGLPVHAVQIVTGDLTTAQTLAADELVNAVTLTGSAAAGFAIQEICACRFRPLQAELSGNNAAIVWEDADLKDAAIRIVSGAFGFAGQRCTANRRVIVNAGQFESLLGELKIAGEQLNWGDPLESATDIGPLIHAGKRDEQARLIKAAQESGAAHRVELLFAARAREAWVAAGAYAQPAIVGCDQPEHTLVQEETMSPLLIIQRAETFEQALNLCNGVRHGLVAALFSRSGRLQEEFLAEAQAGILKINAATSGVDVSLPFSGWKMSGLGPPEHGEGDWQFYTRTQAVYGLK